MTAIHSSLNLQDQLIAAERQVCLVGAQGGAVLINVSKVVGRFAGWRLGIAANAGHLIDLQGLQLSGSVTEPQLNLVLRMFSRQPEPDHKLQPGLPSSVRDMLTRCGSCRLCIGQVWIK